MNKKHYHTSENNILCEQKHKKSGIISLSRFSYNVGDKDNCKNCDRILTKNIKEIDNKCVSFDVLGYKTECQWRIETKCNCIDDCNFKRNDV